VQSEGAPAETGSPSGTAAAADVGVADDVAGGSEAAASEPGEAPPMAQAGGEPGVQAAPEEPVELPVAADAATVTDAEWRGVLERLDGVRAEAFALADPERLDEVYAPDSPALAADRAAVDELVAAGLTVEGARHEVRDVTLLESAPQRARLRVVDVLAAHSVLAVDGAVVEERPARAPAAVEMELVDIGGAWRIAAVSST